MQDIQEAAGRTLVVDIEAVGDEAFFQKADLSKTDEVNSGIDAAIAKIRWIDVLLAGVVLLPSGTTVA